MMTKYDELMSNPEFRKEMAIESLVAAAAEAIAVLMEAQSLNKAEVARRLGKSRAWVTQLLNGKANMTIRTLAEVTFVLGGELTIQPVQKQSGALRREQWRPIAGKMSGFLPAHDGGRYRGSAQDSNFAQTDAEDYAA